MKTKPSEPGRIFVHIPKNGGMTIRKGVYRQKKGHYGIHLGNRANLLSKEYAAALDEAMNEAGEAKGYEHARWRDFKPELREKCRAFAIVRNPWARTASRYTFAVKVGDRAGKQSFRKFLSERHQFASKPFFWHRAVRGWFQQKDHVTDADGVLRCDILRTEHLNDDVERYLGVRYDGRHNVSDTGRNIINISDWRELYGPEEYDIVAEWYKPDIDYFGFDFESPATRNIWCG